MSDILVVQARNSAFYYYAQGFYTFSYHLKEALKFKEPHVARLVSVDGVGRPCLVFADFVKAQSVNGTHQFFLGNWSSSASAPAWVPIESLEIPQTGIVQVKRSDQNPLTSHAQNLSTITVIIEIAPKSRIYGAQSED